MACPINRENVATALMQYGTDFLEDTKLFRKGSGNIVIPIEGVSTQEAIDAVNTLNAQFKEEPIARFTDEETVAIYPSDRLVQSYLPKPKLTQEHQEIIDTINDYIGGQALAVENGSVTEGYIPNNREIDFRESETLPQNPTESKNWTLGFLENLGVNVSQVNDIVINGRRMGANAVALPLQSLVLHTQDGTVNLTEEAMHIAVELISQKNKPLFNEMMEEVTTLPIYQEVYDQYSTDPEYQRNGRPDTNKIKKEAIGKVLAQSIVNKQPIQKAKTWWESIIDFFKGLFGDSGADLIALNKAVDIILSEDLGSIRDTLLQNEVYLEENGIPDDIAQEIISLAASDITDVELRTAIANIIPPIVYKHSTSHLADRVSKNIDAKSSTISTLPDGKFTIDGKIAEDGDIAIAQSVLFDEIEHAEALERIEKKSLGGKVTAALNKFVGKGGIFDSSVIPSNEFEQNMYDRLSLLPTGSKIEINKKIPYKGMVLTIDLLSIDPEGAVTVWNFDEVSVDVGAGERIPSYETKAFRDIVQNQVHALKSIGVTRFGQTRSIPINRVTEQDDTVTITIGDVQVKNKDLDYLAPIPTQTESTSDRALDSVVAALNSLYEKLSSRAKVAPNKEEAYQQIRGLAKSVRSLQIKKDLVPLTRQARLLAEKMDYLVARFENEFDGKNPSKTKYEQFMGEIVTLLQVGDTYRDMGDHLSAVENKSPEFKSELRTLEVATGRVVASMNRLLRANSKLSDQYAENKYEVSGLSTPERVVKFLSRYFRSLSQQTTAALQTLYRMTSEVRGRVDQLLGVEIEVLKDMKNDFQEWMRQNGVTNRTLPNYLFKKGNHKGLRLIDKYDPQFYKDLSKAKKENDIDWINQNIDLEAYNEHISNLRQRKFDEIDRTVYSVDESINENIREEQKERFLDTYDLSRGVSRFNDLLQKYPTDSNFSEQYKEMLKPQNKPLLDVYNKFLSYNDRMAELGIIESFRSRTFYPSIRKSLTEKVLFGGRHSVGQDFLSGLTVNPEDMEYGKIDQDGNLVNDIPVYFIENTVSRRNEKGEWDNSEISTDIFSVLSVMNKQINNYELMSEVESAAGAIGFTERHKEALATNIFGERTKNENINNNQNYSLYEDFVKATIYGQRDANNAWDKKLGKYTGKAARKANKILGAKIFSDDFEGYDITLSKAMDTARRWFSLKTLGMNIPVSITNLFGTSVTGWIESGRWFTKKEFIQNEFTIMAGKITNQKDMKKIALLDFFLPLVDSESTSVRAKQLNLNGTLASYSLSEAIMAVQSVSDKPVQWAIGASWLQNAMLDPNGKLVNIREYLRETEFADLYTSGLTEEQRKTKKQEFEKRVEELKNSKSLLEIAEIKDGKLTIPGLDRTSIEVVRFREQMQQIARNATGMGNQDDIRQINRTFLGRNLMLFKNWMPRLLDRRFGEFRYNPGVNDYEVGRYRLMAGHLGINMFKKVQEFRDIVTLNDRGVNMLLERYEQQREQWVDQNPGKEFKMTPDQYIEMYSRTIKQAITEVAATTALFGILLLAFSGGDDDDFDSHTQKGFWKFSQKVVDKMFNELSFFVNPLEWVNMANGGMFPALSVVTDTWKVIDHTVLREGFGLIVGDDEMRESGKPLKYMLKAIPYTKWISTFMALFMSEGNQKDWGITQQSELGKYQGN